MAGKIRKLFTNEEIYQAAATDDPLGYLHDLRDVDVSRQLFDYWCKHLNEVKANGEPYVGTTVLDRRLANERILRQPTKHDDKSGLNYETGQNRRILVIPDAHAPYNHPDSIPFLRAVANVLAPDRVINLGDETDQHAMSMHDSDPALDAAGPELAKARVFLNELEQLFPEMQLCHSNHGSLIYRRAFKSGIPAEYIKPYRDFIFPQGNGRGWEWADEFRVTLPDGSVVTFRHHFVGNKNQVGHGIRSHICQGHEHGKFYVVYDQTTAAQNWALLSGCLIDVDSMAFAYGKMYEGKPILGCSAIIESQPILIPMLLDANNRWTGELSGAIKCM